MKKLVTIALLVAGSAFAGERLLGIISEIGSSASNLSQNPDGQGAWWDGGFSQPFYVPEMSRLSIICTADMYVCTDKTSCTATEGLPLSTGVILPTSVGDRRGTIDQGRNPDAGLLGGAGINPIRSAVVSVLNTAGDGGYHACKVFERRGNE